MTYPESDYLDVLSLARKYDSGRKEIKETIKRLVELGYKIEILEWGKQKKWKVNYPQFRSALLREYSLKTETTHD